MESKVKEWVEKLNNFCQNKDYKLSDNAERVIERIIRKEGNCPCRILPTPCPCEYHEDEIKEKGKCHCGLFVSKS